MRDLIIEGKYVRLEEVQPKHFPYIIEWRNNPEFNKYLNQPYKLTMESQTKWYEEKYLQDMTQGLFVLVDKEINTPFGTLGWTDYNVREKICIAGRALIGNVEYRGSLVSVEAYQLLFDYLYYGLDTQLHYIHVVNENRKVASLNKRWGFVPHYDNIRFPKELCVNGMTQTEYMRTFEQYEIAKSKILKSVGLC